MAIGWGEVKRYRRKSNCHKVGSEHRQPTPHAGRRILEALDQLLRRRLQRSK